MFTCKGQTKVETWEFILDRLNCSSPQNSHQLFSQVGWETCSPKFLWVCIQKCRENRWSKPWSAVITCFSKFLYSGWFSKVSCHPQQQAKLCYKFKGVLVPNTGWPCSRLSLPTVTSHFEAEQQNEATDQTKTSRTSRETKEVVKCEHQ